MRELEDELGALLLNRTTRQFSLTEAGHTYYRRASEIVREVDSLADAVRESSGDVRGRIKLSAPRTFADAPIGQSLIDFAKQHPDIVLDIHLDDRFVDLVEEGFDLAMRISRLENSSLIARRLAPFSVRLCASPELIAKHGTPTRPQDLANMPCIIDTNGRWLTNWPFKGDDGETVTVSVVRADRGQQPDGGARRRRVGAGLHHPAGFHRRRPTSRSGRLVPLLDDRILSGGGIFAVYPHRRYLPAKVRVFVDFLVQWFKTARRQR